MDGWAWLCPRVEKWEAAERGSPIMLDAYPGSYSTP